MASKSKKIRKQKNRARSGNNAKKAETAEEKRRSRRERRRKKEKIPVTNGSCSRSNESPRCSPTGNKETMRGKESERGGKRGKAGGCSWRRRKWRPIPDKANFTVKTISPLLLPPLQFSGGTKVSFLSRPPIPSPGTADERPKVTVRDSSRFAGNRSGQIER